MAVGLFRNTVANYLGTIVPMVIALFLTPYTIHKLGNTGFGVWTLVGSVSGYLALLDFGLANALAKYTAEYSARNASDTIDRMASSLFFVFAGIGCLALVVAVWVSYHFAQFFRVPPEYVQSGQIAVILLGLNFAISLPLSIFNALTVGFQRYDILNAAAILAWLVNAALTVLALALHWGLIGLSCSIIAMTLVRAGLMQWALRRWQAKVHIRPRLTSVRMFKVMLSYSLFMFVMMACLQIDESTRPVIIGRLLNIDQVAFYSVGLKVSSMVRQFAYPVTAAFFPAFSALGAEADRSRLGPLLTQGLRAAALVGLPLAGFSIILIRPLIRLWIGPEYVGSAGIAVALVVQILLRQQLMAASSLLQGLGKLKVYAAMHVVMVVTGILLGLAVVSEGGALAVAASTVVTWALVWLVTVPYAARIANVRLAHLAAHALFRPASATLVACVALLGLYLWRDPSGLPVLCLEGLAGLAAYGVMVWFTCLSVQERSALRAMAARTGGAFSALVAARRALVRKSP